MSAVSIFNCVCPPGRVWLTGLLSCVAVFFVVAGIALADQVDATPGKSSDRLGQDIEQWTREGELGATPTRATDLAPLSHQQNPNSWVAIPALSDEFEGNSLDPEKWSPTHRKWRGRQPALFSEENVHLADGLMGLTLRKEGGPPLPGEDGYHTYTSAAVHSRILAHYGYYEVRAQAMDSAGSSSFWFAGSGNGWRTEIDVYELSGRGSKLEQSYNMNLHVFYTPTEERHWSVGGRWRAPFRFADGFHVYGLDWSPEQIVYYVDGVEVRRVENTHWHQPLYMIFDTETMPNWLGMPADADLPSTYLVDYVRAWKKSSPHSQRR